jgi:hypothetical protein
MLGSKTGYLMRHSGHQAMFNAHVVTSLGRRIWWGDLDLDLDGAELSALAAREGEDILVFYESDFREGEENDLDRHSARYRPDGGVERKPRQ